eukprot:10446938-Lingulodinium_polyedra.AAC.1
MQLHCGCIQHQQTFSTRQSRGHVAQVVFKQNSARGIPKVGRHRLWRCQKWRYFVLAFCLAAPALVTRQ